MFSFTGLSLTERAEVICESATYIQSIIYNDEKINLFSLSTGQWVEIYCSIRGKNLIQIQRIELVSDAALDKYLCLYSIEI
jgi:hypothetical protein